MLNCTQLRELIIRPALQLINLYSLSAEEMLVATCAQESRGGTFIKQVRGPAFGIYQMEPATHDSIWQEKLMFDDKDGKTINSLGYLILKGCKYIVSVPADTMIHNMFYSAMMARVFWLRFPEPLPSPDDFPEIWRQYKKHWNTEKGDATKEQFIRNYNNFTGRHIILDNIKQPA